MARNSFTQLHTEENRQVGARFLAFGAPLLIIAYYLAFLITANALSGSLTAQASIAPVPFTEEEIDPQVSAPASAHVKSVGDIDGDGLPDVVVGGAGSTSNGLFWYQNPTWTKIAIVPHDPGTGGFSTDMQVGDVDNDGDLDIIVPRANAQGTIGAAVKWFENPRPTGDPAIDPWIEHHIGNADAHDLELADLNNDGLLDVVVRFQAVTIFIQVDAVSDSWVESEVNTRNNEGLALGDLDADGDIDMAINGRWLENRFIQDGAAALTVPWNEWTVDASRNVWSKVFVSDVDQNDQLDVIISTSEQAGGELAWYEPPNPLDPTEGPWSKHSIGFVDYDHSIQTADIDLDGDLDVIVAEMNQSSGDDELRVYYNLDGNGASWDYQVVATKPSHNIRVMDMDMDGDPDIVGADFRNSPISIWWNETGPFTNWERHLVDGARPWRGVLIDSADVDGDGLKDVITGGWWYQNPGAPNGAWVRNAIGDPFKNMAAVFDFDADGDLDILGTQGEGSAANSDLLWAENDGTGAFTIHTNISAGNGDFLQGVAVGPITGAQVEVYLSWHSSTPIQRLIVPIDPVNDVWTIDSVTTDTQQEDLSQGDIDNDGDIDLLLGTRWLQNTGTGWTTHDLFSPLGKPDRNELVDINLDGKLDAVVGYEAISVAGVLAWYEQGLTPTGLWTEHIISDTIVGPMSLDVEDMDGDGDFDVVAGEHNYANPTAARLLIFENLDGAGGSWKQHVVYTGDEHHDGAQTVDIDNDGDLDIVSIGWNESPAGVFLYENRGAAPSLPVARPDTYSTEQETLLTLVAPGVLTNDATPGSGISVALDTDVSNGQLNLSADGSFTYMPNAGFTGVDSFNYVVSNDTDTSPPGIVTLNVTGVNLPPIGNTDTYSVNRGGVARISEPGVLQNDQEPNGDPLTAQLLSGPLFGELSLAPDGSFEYIHLGGSELQDTFSYSGFDGQLSSDPTTVFIDITAALPRHQDGLLALYPFDEGAGSTVRDNSGAGSALDLTIQDPAAVTWNPGSLSVNSSTVINSVVAASKLNTPAANEISVEAWIKTSSLSQSGPARIATLSSDTLLRNITVGQDDAEFSVRLRTTTNGLNGTPATETTGSTVSGGLQHLIYTRDQFGNSNIYIDGLLVKTEVVAGDLSNWNAGYQFAIGNEVSFESEPADDRPWLGELRLVAVYSAALTQAEVTANYSAGPEAGTMIKGSISLDGVANTSAEFSVIAPQIALDNGSETTSFPVSPDGTFAVTVEDGTYMITVSAPGFVSKQRIGQVISGGTIDMPAVVLAAGIVNQDEFVTGADISAIAANVGISSSDRTNGINSNLIDLDADLSVTVADLLLAFASFGKTTPETDW